MTKAYIKLPKRAARYTSRRFNAQAAFLTDAPDIMTKEGLLKHLDTMKTDLEKALLNKTEQLETDVKITVKAFDQLQARMKGMPFSTTPESFSVEGILKKTIFDSTDQIQKFLRKETSGDLILKVVGDLSTGNVTGGTATLSSILPDIIRNPNRKQHIGPLLARISVKGDLIYLKENGAGEGSISAVSEGGTKTQIDFDLAEVTAPANFIAGYARVSRRFLLSVNNAQDFLVSRLSEAYYRAEDNALLNGTGISPEMKGFQVAGNYTAATLGTGTPYTQIVKAIGQLAALERNPELVLLHPDDYFRLLTNVAPLTGEYDSPEVVQFSPDGKTMMIAGCQVIYTTAQTVGVFSVVDRSGLLIGVLDNFNIRFFEGGTTEVISNKILVRAESAIALAVFANNYVIKATFNAFVS